MQNLSVVRHSRVTLELHVLFNRSFKVTSLIRVFGCLLDNNHTARRQLDEPVSRASDYSIVKSGMSHEASDQQVEATLLNEFHDCRYRMPRQNVAMEN